MKEQKIIPKTETKRVSLKVYLKPDDSSKIEELMKTLRGRGWKKGKEETVRLLDLIIDELFLKAGNGFYEEVLNKLTPLEYLFKTKMDNPTLRREMEKILKKKV